ncbi:MAG: 16S rRNA (adenine(1518)-N(6)/adenine(1519)-N(6))-dimethyltransferase RsmA [Gammaproteobacteria bacterium]|nr:16S rRNA (adenine(1518)-N(6)/adenine(1519)-N(6))-dimethyltransferase RsmA [Gammaproteobacteria bacterium]
MSPHRPRKRFGQNFLIDSDVIEKIVTAIDPQPQQPLLEIGPGQGALTQELLRHIEHLTAVEIDRDLVALLSRQFGKNRLTLHSEDILNFSLHRLQLPQNKRLRVVGNLPYNISTPLIFHLLQQSELIADMHFMLQEEVADRLVAPAGGKTYGKLTVMASYHCRIEKLFTVPPSAFSPPPQVHSALVRLTPHRPLPVAVDQLSSLEKVVATAFIQRRKTIRNSLKKILPSTMIKQAGVNPTLRPEQLSLSQFALLANQLSSRADD